MPEQIITTSGETGYIEHEFAVREKRLFLIVTDLPRALILNQADFMPIEKAKWIPKVGMRVRIPRSMSSVDVYGGNQIRRYRENQTGGTIRSFSHDGFGGGKWYVAFDPDPQAQYPFHWIELEPENA